MRRISPSRLAHVDTPSRHHLPICGLLQSGGMDFGTDSPRPVWVKEYDGLWYTINNASTYLRVRPPRAAIEKRKNAHDADYDNVPSK